MNKIIVLIGIFLAFCLFGLGAYGIINKGNTIINEPSKPLIKEKKNLVCTGTHFDDIYDAISTTTLNMSFENDELIEMTSKTVYQYSDITTYQNKWSSMVNRSGYSEVTGIKNTWQLDDTNYTYTINEVGEIELMKSKDWGNNNGTDYSYDSMLIYASNLDLTCR